MGLNDLGGLKRVCRTRRRAACGRPKYKDYFTDDASLSESADVAEEDDEDDDEVDEFLSEISMREGRYGMQSRNSSLESADASFRSAGEEIKAFCCMNVHASNTPDLHAR